MTLLKTNNYRRQPNQGFTLVEAMVSISILVVAVTATIGTISKGLSDTIFAKEKVVATALAHDGLEYIHHDFTNEALKDEDKFIQTEWVKKKDDYIAFCADTSSKRCWVNTVPGATTASFDTCTTAVGCKALELESGTNRYGYFGGSGSPTPFVRYFTVRSENNHEIRIDMTVEFSKSGRSDSVTITRYLVHWQ